MLSGVSDKIFFGDFSFLSKKMINQKLFQLGECDGDGNIWTNME